ncbi:MAG: GTP-binding protein [Saprospiraceae bacterium]|nr:GTP-binding protein [Saprospiraceae bacterium]
MYQKKIMLTGSFGVGKTSLFNRFIHQVFDEVYQTTIGVKVDTKVVETALGEVKLAIWDVAGEVTQNKVPDTYWLGTKGVIYVIDLHRTSTFEHVAADLEYIKKMVPDVIIKIAANKKDLVTEARIKEVAEKYPIDIFTSAKTGENVEELFKNLAEVVLLK